MRLASGREQHNREWPALLQLHMTLAAWAEQPWTLRAKTPGP